MATLEQLKAYDRKKAMFCAESVLTTGAEDYFGKSFSKVGRRHVWQFERFNQHGVQVSCHMYVSDVIKHLKAGSLSVYIK